MSIYQSHTGMLSINTRNESMYILPRQNSIRNLNLLIQIAFQVVHLLTFRLDLKRRETGYKFTSTRINDERLKILCELFVLKEINVNYF